MTATHVPIRRALISVSDKMGLGGFARALQDQGVEIFSTGGTARYLKQEGLEVVDVADYTQFPEMMSGRVKTLHPKIFGGILGRRDVPGDLHSMEEHEMAQFDLVVVNLYPFEATIAREDVTESEAIEQIDIGGPSLVRAAAKNHAFVAIATSPEQYSSILGELQEHGGTSFELRQRLAGEAFQRTASYDQAISAYFASQRSTEEFPPALNLPLRRRAELRYGENPHQPAAVYADADARGANLISARKLNGKELSYNNLLDLDAALAMVRRFDQPAAVVIKHNNPCGAAVGATAVEAIEKAMAGDPVSAFGSILGFNCTVDEEVAELLAEPGLFVEAIVAPDYEASAVGILTTRPKWKNNVRLMQVGKLGTREPHWDFRRITGGMLVQAADSLDDPTAGWSCVTKASADDFIDELKFAWEMVRHVKSNAIVVCRDQSLVGCGAGQMSRVDSVDIAISKAGDRTTDAVLGSDAFFPFPDSIHKAEAAGIRAIIQPGGSKKDAEVIAACDEHGIAMLFTGRRHFKH